MPALAGGYEALSLFDRGYGGTYSYRLLLPKTNGAQDRGLALDERS